MKKDLSILILILIGLFSAQYVTAQSYTYIYSSVSYDSNTNMVSVYAYTSADYTSWYYYQNGVYSAVFDPDGNLLHFLNTSVSYAPAEVNFTVPGNGCGNYYVDSYHWLFETYYLQDYYWQGQYTSGYYDPYNYYSYEGYPQGYYLGFAAIYGPGPEWMTQDTFRLLGMTDNYSNTSCSTAEIEKIEFEAIGGPIDDHPAINGLTSNNKGKRIYPDKNSPGDGTDRTKVRIKATVTPATQGVKIYFKSYDMDDPYTDAFPLDPTSSGGNDNKGLVDGKKEGKLSAGSATTNSAGVATVELTVTKNPGDNFAVVAAKDSNSLRRLDVGGTDLLRYGQAIPIYKASNPPSPTTPTNPAMRTELLTVWRRLHIEVDSMGIVSGNNISGVFPSNQTIAASGTTTLLLNPSTSLDDNRFENGRLVVGTTSFTVVDHTTTNPPNPMTINVANTANTVTVTNSTGMPFAVTNGQSFTLYDDDDFNNDDGTNFDGDAGNENVDLPDLGILQPSDIPCTNVSTTNNCNVLASAFVMPTYDLSGSLEDIPFQLNVDYPAITNIFNNSNLFDNRGSQANVDFWTIYLLGAYQYTNDADSDPDEFGATFGLADAAGINAQGLVVFIELNRAREYADLDRYTTPSWQNRPVANRFTTAHEVGHLFDGDHDDEVNGNAGLMRQSINRTQAVYSHVTLNKIRGGTGITYP